MPVLVLETGVGPARAESALGWLLEEPILAGGPYRPRAVISAGFCGALREGLGIGDVVLATDVVDAEGQHWPATWPREPPAEEGPPRLQRGRIFCSAHLVGCPKEKRTFGQKFDALAVDMESATIARRCVHQSIPFGCVRAVSDDLKTPLSPVLLAFLADERVAPLRLLAGLVQAPSLAGDLCRLARATRLAAEQLRKALCALVGNHT